MDELIKRIGNLENSVNTLLNIVAPVLKEIPQDDTEEFLLHTSVTPSFKGVLTFIPIHSSKTIDKKTSNKETSILQLKNIANNVTQCNLYVANQQGFRRPLMDNDITVNKPCQLIFISDTEAIVLNPNTNIISDTSGIESSIEDIKSEIYNIQQTLNDMPEFVIGTAPAEETLTESDDNVIYFRVKEGI